MTRTGTRPKGSQSSKEDFVNGNMPSSEGRSPVEMTPKDISPENATWNDRYCRPIAADDAEVRDEAILDEAVELTFPASDPIAPSSVTKIERSHGEEAKPKNKK